MIVARRARLVWLSAVVGVLILIWPTVVSTLFQNADSSVYPTLDNLIPALCLCLLASVLSSPFAVLLAYVWLFWYFIGSTNTLASSIVLGSYYSNLRLGPATAIYFWAAVSYFLGVLLHERITGRRTASRYSENRVRRGLKAPAALFLLIFPFIWLISIYAKLGYIPLLRGGSIVDDMYELDYGALYPYGSVIIISILYAGYCAITARNRQVRWFYWLLVGLYVLISNADGKRAIALVSMAGLLAVGFRVRGARAWRALPLAAALLLASYVGVMLIRAGGDAHQTEGSIYPQLMLVGVEFRDFVYTVNYFDPGKIQGYDWLQSLIGAVGNGFALSLLGLDKATLVAEGSANAWAALWNTKFGIRTGIVSELWFAYGWISYCLLFFLGLGSSWCIQRVRQARTSLGLIFSAAVYGLILLLVTSQSTFTAGVLPTFGYLYLALRAADLLSVPSRVGYGPRRLA